SKRSCLGPAAGKLAAILLWATVGTAAASARDATGLGPSARERIVEALNKRVEDLSATDSTDRALALAESVAVIAEHQLGPRHPLLARSLTNLAGLQRLRGDRAKAQGPTDHDVMVVRFADGHTLQARLADRPQDSAYKRAEALYKRAFTIEVK